MVGRSSGRYDPSPGLSSPQLIKVIEKGLIGFVQPRVELIDLFITSTGFTIRPISFFH
jgi:hypothetical protein